jgi:hypothetical protein
MSLEWQSTMKYPTPAVSHLLYHIDFSINMQTLRVWEGRTLKGWIPGVSHVYRYDTINKICDPAGVARSAQHENLYTHENPPGLTTPSPLSNTNNPPNHFHHSCQTIMCESCNSSTEFCNFSPN